MRGTCSTCRHWMATQPMQGECHFGPPGVFLAGFQQPPQGLAGLARQLQPQPLIMSAFPPTQAGAYCGCWAEDPEQAQRMAEAIDTASTAFREPREPVTQDVDITVTPPVAVPSGIYWSREAGNFYDADGQGQGIAFYEDWQGRKDDFPTRRTYHTVPGVDLELTGKVEFLDDEPPALTVREGDLSDSLGLANDD
jgi:hypothetical protein